jgi:hypothetical protein
MRKVTQVKINILWEMKRKVLKFLTTLILTAKGQVCFIDSCCHRLGELSLAVILVK